MRPINEAQILTENMLNACETLPVLVKQGLLTAKQFNDYLAAQIKIIREFTLNPNQYDVFH